VTASALHVWRRRSIGNVHCSLAIGLSFFFLGAIDSLAHGGHVFNEHWTPARQAMACVQVIGVFGFPILIIYAVIMHGLRRFDRDTLAITLLMSVLVIGSPILVSALSAPRWPSGSDLVRLLPALPFSAGIGALYWLVVVRVERREAREQKETVQAIAAKR
jgi:hypothetical protein